VLVALGLVATRLPGRAVTVCVGFIAAVQITNLSHIGSWSFNTGMMTGNLRSGATALVQATTGSNQEWPHAGVMLVLCVAFAIGATVGVWLTPRIGSATLTGVSALIAFVMPPALRISPRFPTGANWTDAQGRRGSAWAGRRIHSPGAIARD
jgi:uncharacterized membrane protein YoaK (UPF0700 family)